MTAKIILPTISETGSPVSAPINKPGTATSKATAMKTQPAVPPLDLRGIGGAAALRVPAVLEGPYTSTGIGSAKSL